MRQATHSIEHIDAKHLAWFIAGAMHEYCDRSGALAAHETRLRQDYINNPVEVTLGYLKGTRDLDGTCSDMQCTVAMEARKVFKPIKIAGAKPPVEGGVCEHCGGPNMDHMGGSCRGGL